VLGSVDGDSVVFGAVFSDAAQAQFEGTIVEDGLTIEGSYGVSDGQCAGDSGTWRVVKIIEPGDANSDGTIDDRDARHLFRLLLGGRPTLLGNADCNKDGVVNFRDVIAIFKSR
jgi:Dockerin type I domain